MAPSRVTVGTEQLLEQFGPSARGESTILFFQVARTQLIIGERREYKLHNVWLKRTYPVAPEDAGSNSCSFSSINWDRGITSCREF